MNFDSELAKFQAELEAVERPSVTLGGYSQNYAPQQNLPPYNTYQPMPIPPMRPPSMPPPMMHPPPMMYQQQSHVQYQDNYGYTDTSAYDTGTGYASGGQYAQPQAAGGQYAQPQAAGGQYAQPQATGGQNKPQAPGTAPTAAATAVAPGKGKPPQGKGSKGVFRTAGGEKWFDPTLDTWPENDFRIFVGDIGNEVNDDVLGRAFNKYSSFAKAKVVRDSRSKKSKGYGFVSFLDGNDFAKALREMNGKYIGNRPCKLTKSSWVDRCSDKRKAEPVAHVPVGNSGPKRPKSVLHK